MPHVRSTVFAAVAAVAFAGSVVLGDPTALAAPAPPPNLAVEAGFKVADKTLWVIETVATGDGSLQAKTLPTHLRHQMDLEKSGVLFAAGPMRPVGGTGRIGLIIIRAADEAEAKRIADSDPMHQNGARTYKLYRWTLNEGSMDLRFTFSDGKLGLE
jgi:uncharacterized protein YciI